MPRLTTPLIAALLASATLVVSGCGGDDKGGSSSTATTGTGGKVAATSDAGAAALRATLTTELQSNVYLIGATVAAGLRDGFTSTSYVAAKASADANADALGKTYASIAGATAGGQLVALWSKQLDFYVAYAKGKATMNEIATDTAVGSLDTFRGQLGTLLAEDSKKISAAKISSALTPQTQSLVAAIDAMVAGSVKVAEQLQIAGSHAPPMAELIADASTREHPDRFAGSAKSPAATLRAALTSQATDHAYLAAFLVRGVIAGPNAAKRLKAVKVTLDENSVALSETISSVYGQDAGQDFLARWRAQLKWLADYTQAKVLRDNPAATAALTELDTERMALATLFAAASPDVTKQVVTTALAPQVTSLSAVVRAEVAASDKAYERTRDAGNAMSAIAGFLARTITTQFADKFPSS